MSMPQNPPKPGRNAYYWANLLLLVAVAVGASVWFSRHLESYVNQVVLLGGGVSLWAALKMTWTLFESFTKTDPKELSRGLLSSAELSRLLIAALAVLATLWFTTGSQYFEYDGPGAVDASFSVHVLLDDEQNKGKPLTDRQSFVADALLSPKDRIQGRAFYWLTSAVPLLCVLEKKGVPYDPRDCSIRPRGSTRVKVPGDFHLKKVHLLRFIPSIDLYGRLPSKDAPVSTIAFRLTISLGTKSHVVEDVRKGIVYVGGPPDEMDELVAMQVGDELRTTIRTDLMAKHISAESADQSVANLVSNQRKHGKYRLETGQKLSFLLEQLTMADGKVISTVAIGTPLSYEVTDEKVQTIWLPGS